MPIKTAIEKDFKEFDMAIEITGRTNGPTFIKTPPKTETDGERKTTLTHTERGDSVALTSATQQIKKAIGSSSASPVDVDRVNSVKKALADGSYSVNAGRVAQKLIQLEKLIPPENST